MSKATTFGFSAFLRIALMNEKPQKTEVRNRHKPVKSGGYDFHRSIRSNISQFCDGSMTPDQALLSISAIAQEPERKAAASGFTKFLEWDKTNGAGYSAGGAVTMESPLKQFKLTFQPDFVKELNKRRTAVHVWNSKSDLDKRIVLACLSIIANEANGNQEIDDFAVLSLKNLQIFKWSDASQAHLSLGMAIVNHIDKLCILAREHHNLPHVGIMDQRPEA